MSTLDELRSERQALEKEYRDALDALDSKIEALENANCVWTVETYYPIGSEVLSVYTTPEAARAALPDDSSLHTYRVRRYPLNKTKAENTEQADE